MFSALRFSVGVFALLLLPALAPGQDAPHAVAKGTIVDSAKAPLPGVQVLVFDSTDRVLATARTDSSGEFTVSGLAPGTRYQFSMRKLGFAMGTVTLATPKAGDTLWVDALLQRGPPTLDAVHVTGSSPAYHIKADEIAKEPVQNGLDVVLRYRPRMMGDVYHECRPDTSHLGPPLPPTIPAFGGAPSARGMGGSVRGNGASRPQFSVPSTVTTSRMFDTSLAMHGYPPSLRLSDPADTLGKTPTVLYVNGVLQSMPGMKNILQDIPAEDIAEMHYIDCWDTAYPLELRNALFVVLKPGKSY